MPLLEDYLEDQFVNKKKSFLLIPTLEDSSKFYSHEFFVQHMTEKTKALYDIVIQTVPLKDYPTSLDDFNYHYNEQGELRNKINGAPFHFVSQRHYEALGDFIYRYIQDVMISKYHLQEVYLPLVQNEDTSNYRQRLVQQELCKNNIFMSQDALSNPNKLMVLIQGSGAVRAGQWARALCINTNLREGAQLEYIEKAQQQGYGVIVVNPNLNFIPKKEVLDPNLYTRTGFLMPDKPKPIPRDARIPIPSNQSPPEHCIYVWDTFVNQAKAKDVVIVAHSAGGWCTMELLKARQDVVLKRLRGVAFTDAVHSVMPSDPPAVKKFIVNKAINWVTSNKPLDTLLYDKTSTSCTLLSCGHEKHENSSSSCIESAFRFLEQCIAQQ